MGNYFVQIHYIDCGSTSDPKNPPEIISDPTLPKFNQRYLDSIHFRDLVSVAVKLLPQEKAEIYQAFLRIMPTMKDVGAEEQPPPTIIDQKSCQAIAENLRKYSSISFFSFIFWSAIKSHIVLAVENVPVHLNPVEVKEVAQYLDPEVAGPKPKGWRQWIFLAGCHLADSDWAQGPPLEFSEFLLYLPLTCKVLEHYKACLLAASKKGYSLMRFSTPL